MAKKIKLDSVTKINPSVELIKDTAAAYDLSVAAARTCYSPKCIDTEQVTEKNREFIGKGIFEGGHHTPFQMPNFIFKLDDVSRHFVWSVLHSHPWYNSDQVSQRYVVMNEAKVHIPDDLNNVQREIYETAVLGAWQAYAELKDSIYPNMLNTMKGIGKIKRMSDKEIAGVAEKKAIETARYVLPIATYTSLWHVVSGLTLHRYHRLMNANDVPAESRKIITSMVDAVKAVDKDFFDKIGEGPIPEEQTLEHKIINSHEPNLDFKKHFDGILLDKTSRLVDYSKNAERIIADSVREVTGRMLTMDEAIAYALDPDQNPYLMDTLNLYSHSPVMRALNNTSYVFKKKLSHTADSQDQRHRTTPASRPLFSAVVSGNPDFIEPDIIKNDEASLSAYKDQMDKAWNARNKLIDAGASEESANYLLPNAAAIRFTETSRLIDLVHKFRMRLCFNAQKEIFNASMDEFEQINAVQPMLMKYIGPACVNRNDRVEHKEIEGPCPEGKRYCGIPVWKNFPKVKRPF